jgi:hypothetical protein
LFSSNILCPFYRVAFDGTAGRLERHRPKVRSGGGYPFSVLPDKFRAALCLPIAAQMSLWSILDAG